MQLKEKIQDVLNEARILVLGTQVLLGFQYQALFYPGYERLPLYGRWANLVALILGILALCLLMAPGPFHRIVDDGNDTTHLQRFASRMVELALPMLAVVLALDVAVMTERTVGRVAAWSIGGLILAGASLFWGILGMKHRTQSLGSQIAQRRHQATLSEKIQTLLTEARVILPGVQALLGFQLAAMLTDRFEKLPLSSRLIHVGSLFAMALAIVLLIAPAAYHRLAADGEPREDVDRFGVRSVMSAIVPLGLGLTGDLYVLAATQFERPAAAVATALVALAAFAGLWAAYPLWARRRNGSG